jgi:hypothetical protein
VAAQISAMLLGSRARSYAHRVANNDRPQVGRRAWLSKELKQCLHSEGCRARAEAGKHHRVGRRAQSGTARSRCFGSRMPPGTAAASRRKAAPTNRTYVFTTAGICQTYAHRMTEAAELMAGAKPCAAWARSGMSRRAACRSAAAVRHSAVARFGAYLHLSTPSEVRLQ